MNRTFAVLPKSWQAELAASTIRPVIHGLGGASVFRVSTPGSGDRYLKIGRGRAGDDLRSEIERTEWLGRQGVRVPEVVEKHDSGRIVAALLTEMPGTPPPASGAPAAEIVARLARAFAALHSLPLAACPYDETITVRLARARRDIKRGAVDPDAFEDRNRGVTAKALYARLAGTVPATEDLVVVHGDATFDNVVIDGGGNVGFIDCGHAGRADRYVDLALVAAEIESHFGAEWVAPFARSYGAEPWDPAKARFFSDLYELF